LPPESPTTQKIELVHETDWRVSTSSIRSPLVQLVPSYEYPYPSLSTASQKEELAHETESKAELLESTRVGPLHDVPFQVSAPPLASTATQNCELVHEIELRV
jgi:hypothetical protein